MCPVRAVIRQLPDAVVLPHGPRGARRVDVQSRRRDERGSPGRSSASASARSVGTSITHVGIHVRPREHGRAARSPALSAAIFDACATSTTETRAPYGCRDPAVSSVHPFATTTTSSSCAAESADDARRAVGAMTRRLVVGGDHDATSAPSRGHPDRRPARAARPPSAPSARASARTPRACGASVSSQAPTASSMQRMKKVWKNPNAS